MKGGATAISNFPSQNPGRSGTGASFDDAFRRLDSRKMDPELPRRSGQLY